MTSRTGNFNDRRRWRGGGVRNQYGQVVKVNGTLKTDKQQNNKKDKETNLGGGKKTKARHLPHPKAMSYPVAITPDEASGTRLLIKCFEYLPQTTSFSTGFTLKRTDKAGVYKGRKYEKGDALRDKDGNIEMVPTNLKFENQGSSDQISNSGMKHHYYVELPIPQDVNDTNTVTWGDDTLNVFQLAGLQAAANFVEKPGQTFEDLKTLLTTAATEGMDLSADLKKAVGAGIAGKAIDPQGNNISVNSAISRATGQVLNNNLELLFNSVNLRSFPMNVVFSPRNYDESMMVKHIIRAFKSSMAAKKGLGGDGQPVSGQGGIFLKSPDVFQIRYLHNGADHPFLNSFKHCALTGMSVNYTNAGTFASYADGTPVSIQMSLTFKELNPIYHEDYAEFYENDTNGVGY